MFHNKRNRKRGRGRGGGGECSLKQSIVCKATFELILGRVESRARDERGEERREEKSCFDHKIRRDINFDLI